MSKKSAKSFRDKIKSLELHKKTGSKIEMIAELINPMVRGWLNYFMSYCKSAVKYTMKCLNDRLCRWSMRKYKRFRGHKMRAKEWLGELAKREPNLVTAQQPPHHPKRKPSANTEGLIIHDS